LGQRRIHLGTSQNCEREASTLSPSIVKLTTTGQSAQIAPKVVRVSIRKETLDLLVSTFPDRNGPG
jgi:hypothetical protein